MFFSSRNIPILSYHKIDRRAEWGLTCVKPDRFSRQMAYLKNEGYQPITFHNLYSGTLPDKPIIITFDDGYRSVYRNAFPVLQETGFSAVVFLITGYIGKLNTWDANIGGIRFAHLDEGQIAEMSRAGVEIASHTVSHRALTYLSDNEVRRELETSRRRLAEICQREIISLAYPFGLQNSRVRHIARRCGYRFGCVNIWGGNHGTDILNLRRIPVYRSDSFGDFRRKLSAGTGHKIELAKLRVISWPARLTPVYQRFRVKNR